MSEFNSLFPQWVSGRLPQPKVKMTAPPHPKGTLVRLFGRQMFNNSKEVFNKISNCWSPQFDEDNLLFRLKSYTNQLIEIYLATQECPVKIPKKLVQEVGSLEIANEQFSLYISEVKKKLPEESGALIILLDALINESRFFIFQFDATVDLVWTGKNFPFKPTDRIRKHAFLKAVINWSDKRNGLKFPPYFELIRLPELNGFRIPNKTYGLWKKQLLNGTLHLFFQPRKNRQLVIAKLKDK